MKTSLYFKSGNSDKEYHVEQNEGNVTVLYGRRGSALTKLNKMVDGDLTKAQKLYAKLIKDKKAKGYQEGEAGVEYTPAVDPEETGYRPQLLNEISEDSMKLLLDNNLWLMQEKEDGRNIGIVYNDGIAIASNKKGLRISIPVEIIDAVQDTMKSNLTLYGELVDTTFKVWDITVPGMPPAMNYIDRYQMLRSVVSKIGSVHILKTRTAITLQEKYQLFIDIENEKGEGVVFKKMDAPYTPGRPASGGDQLKYKFTATCSVMAGPKNEGKESISLWMYTDKQKVVDGTTIFPELVNVGNATVYANQVFPKKGDVVEIKYLYAYRGGSLYQPVLLGIRDDVDHTECVLTQLKYKQGQ